jgi:O-antigen ligase
MSSWPSQPGVLIRQYRPSPIGLPAARWARARRARARTLIWLSILVCVLIAEGIAVAHSYLWAAPLGCLLIVAVAVDLPLVPFLGLAFLARVLTDDLSSPNSRHSGALNLSGAIAVLFILVGLGLILRRRQQVRPIALAVIWLCLWTALAVISRGASTETIREGLREISVVALAAIVCNSRGLLDVSVVTRLVQLIGFIPASLALYQLVTHTGLLVAGHIRSNGTFVHPNAAAIYFAIAATVSIWRYVDRGRRRADVLFAVIFAAALIATFSLGGLASLLVMLIAFGMLRPGSFRIKLGSYAAVGAIVIVFLATPLGAERIANESSTRLSTARGSVNTSLAWRLYKWGTLIPEWERSPLLGQGLGTTTTTEGTSENHIEGFVPHNEYIRYLVETGAVGFATLLWAATLLFRALYRRSRLLGTFNSGTLGIAILVGCLVDALVDNTFLDSPTAYAAALVVTAILASPVNVAALQRSSRRLKVAGRIPGKSPKPASFRPHQI